MKTFLRILILLQIVILFMGCESKEISLLLYKDETDSISSNENADNLNYTIDKITLSKSYQSVEPNIEILKNGIDSKLLLSLGIVESSGINIEKIEKDNRDVNIFVQNQTKNEKAELVVPQIMIKFKDLSKKDLENLNFKIVNRNYEPIKTSIDIGEAISKIKSSLKIATSTFPSSKLKQENGKMFLDLDFTNVVDLANKENPIINLNVLIDLIDGEIVKSDKKSVSSLIDEGDILEYVQNKYLLYVKEIDAKNDINYELWMHDIEKNTEDKIYTSKYKICSLKFNDNNDKALLIESSGDYSELYILELKDLKVFKTKLDKSINPSEAIWKDKDIVLIDKEDDIAKLYSYNTSNDNLKFLSRMDKDIKQIQYLNENFLFSIENESDKNVYLTKDFKEKILVDSGKNPLFIDDQTIGYLKNNSADENVLWFYNLKDETIKSYSDINVQDYFTWKNNIAIIEKTQIGSDNPLYIYNLEKEEVEFLTSIKSNKIFLNTEKNILYINSSIDLGEDKTSVISYLNLENKKIP